MSNNDKNTIVLQYFYGQDTFGAREDIARIAKGMEVQWIDREALDRTPFEQRLDQAAGRLFGSAALVVQDPSVLPQAQQESIIEMIEGTNTRVTPVILWDRVKPDKRLKLFRALKPYARQYPQLKKDACVNWLLGQAKVHAVTLGSAAAHLLIQYVGMDRWRLQTELERLSLLGAPITEEVIAEQVSPAMNDIEIFPLLDALSRGNQAKTVLQLEQLWQAGQSAFYILSMLMYQFRTLLAIHQEQAHTSSVGLVAQQLGLKLFVVEKNWHTASRLPVATYLQALSRTMATDFTIKQGKVDNRTAVTMLVLALAKDCAKVNARP